MVSVDDELGEETLVMDLLLLRALLLEPLLLHQQPGHRSVPLHAPARLRAAVDARLGSGGVPASGSAERAVGAGWLRGAVAGAVAGAVGLILGRLCVLELLELRLGLLELLAAPLEVLHLLLDLGLGLLGLLGALGLAVGRGRGVRGVVGGGLVGALLSVLRLQLGLLELPVGLVQVLLGRLHRFALPLRRGLGLLHLGPQVVVLHLRLPLAAVGVLVLHEVVVEFARVLHQRVRMVEVEI
mmetsp:Transcript_16574/g.47004  ORF Transcript_16574/g.47004 Transcript_16574/m.47004 type:complete len:241 (-) Transcript_16574:399-1121(-)